MVKFLVAYLYLINQETIVPLLLQVNENNSDATKFYLKLGFVHVVPSTRSTGQFDEINWNKKGKKYLIRAWSVERKQEQFTELRVAN